MTTINKIMALQTVDRTMDTNFGADSGNLGFTQVPLQANGFQVFINRAFVVNDTLTDAKDLAGVSSIMATSAAGGSSIPASASDLTIPGGAGNVPAAVSGGASLSASNVVPEPSSLVLTLLSMLASGCCARRRRSR